MASMVIGKSFTYFSLYALFSVFFVGASSLVFQLPHLVYPGNRGTYDTLYSLLPVSLGLACSLFFSDSDAPLLLVAFSL